MYEQPSATCVRCGAEVDGLADYDEETGQETTLCDECASHPIRYQEESAE